MMTHVEEFENSITLAVIYSRKYYANKAIAQEQLTRNENDVLRTEIVELLKESVDLLEARNRMFVKRLEEKK
jgi:hypothetical protein